MSNSRWLTQSASHIKTGKKSWFIRFFENFKNFQKHFERFILHNKMWNRDHFTLVGRPNKSLTCGWNHGLSSYFSLVKILLSSITYRQTPCTRSRLNANKDTQCFQLIQFIGSNFTCTIMMSNDESLVQKRAFRKCRQ